MDGVTDFEAECLDDGWNVSHPVGCFMPDSIISGVTPQNNTCQNLTLSEIRCIHPLCPEPNGTFLTGRTMEIDVEQHILTYHEVEERLVNEADANISFTCKEDSEYNFEFLKVFEVTLKPSPSSH